MGTMVSILYAPCLLILRAPDVMADSHAPGVLKMISTAFTANSNQICKVDTLKVPGIIDSLQVYRIQGKSDKILETVLRMDGLLRSIHENLVREHAHLSTVSKAGLI